MCNGCEPFQFPISSPRPFEFERNKGVGCGSLYYGLAHYQIWQQKCYKRLACANLIILFHLQINQQHFSQITKKVKGQKYFGCFHPTPFNSTNLKS